MIKNIRGQKCYMRNEITGDVEETLYTVIMEEEDREIPGLIWLYLESEYGDENIEFEPKFNIHYAKITNNHENLIVI